MIEKNLFIQLSKKKSPINKWQNKGNRFTAAEIIKHEDNWGLVPPRGFLVIDADSKEAEARINSVLNMYGIKEIPTWATTRGRHWLFKLTITQTPNPAPTSHSGPKKNLLSIAKLDYKGWDGGYVNIKDRVDPQAVEDLILKTPEKIPELPILLHPNQARFDVDDFPEGERHDKMFRQWIPELSKKWTNDMQMQIMLLFDLITLYHGDNEKPDEIRKWVETNVTSSRAKGVIETDLQGRYDPYIMKDPVFGIPNFIHNYNGIYKTLVKHLKLVEDMDSPGTYWAWNDYEEAMNVVLDTGTLIRREVMTHMPDVKPSILSEIIMGLPGHIPRIRYDLGEEFVVFKNGTYNSFTKEFVGTIPDFAPNVIPHNYIAMSDDDFKSTHGTTLDWLNNKETGLFASWAKTPKGDLDPGIITILYELIGLFMTNITRHEKAYILYGNASNGKSEYIKILQAILSRHNYASEDLSSLSDTTWGTSQLYRKKANINSDNSSHVIKDASGFKKLSSGEYISAQFKNKQIFTFKNYARLLFAMNAIPYIMDGADSDAIDRRMLPIHFRNKFEGDARAWKKIQDYMLSDKVIEVIIRHSLDSFHRAWHKNKKGALTTPATTKELMAQYLTDSDHVFEFLNSRILQPTNEIQTLYQSYLTWTDVWNYKRKVTKPTFIKKIHKFYRRRGLFVHEEKQYSKDRAEYVETIIISQ